MKIVIDIPKAIYDQICKEELDGIMARAIRCGRPLIRCEDCAKREYCRTSTVWAVAPDDDWYCADAERKGETDNGKTDKEQF